MIGASVGQKLISLTYFTILARELGAEKLGLYTAALAMTTIFVIFADLGFTNVFIREASKDRSRTQELFSNVLFIKIFLGILSYIALVVSLEVLGFEGQFKALVYLSGLTMLLDSLHLTLYGVLRIHNNLRYEALSLPTVQLLTLILGFIFLKFGMPLIFLILAFSITSALNVLYAAFIAMRRFGLRFEIRQNRKLLRTLALIALPFGLAAVCGRLYSYADVILLKKLATAAEVGFYSTPSKITFAFQFIPLGLIAALYPRFSEYFEHDKSKLAQSFEQSLSFLFMVALPISTGIYLLADQIVVFAFTSEFIPSVVPLKILIISLVFSFVSFPIGAFLNACSRQNVQTAITALVLVFNISANMFLIPRLGATGAAFSALGANILLGILGYIFARGLAPIPHLLIARHLISTILSALVMGIVVWWSARHVHLFYSIALGFLVYLCMLFATGRLTRKELREFLSLFKA